MRLALTADDRILCVLPLSHTYGLYHLIMSVRLGATLALEHGVTFPGRIVEWGLVSDAYWPNSRTVEEESA